MAAVELLIIGNEILSGDTLDTNSQWLAQRLQQLGATPRRRTTIADEPGEIVEAVRAARDRGADVLITAGGLGPTFDDITVRCVGEALGRPVTEREDALEMVARRYRELHAEGAVDAPDLLPARRKMAAVPEGGDIIANTVGTAPGVLLDVGELLVLCFPGVPRELYAMFDEANVQAALARRLGGNHVRQAQLVTPYNDESVLGPVCDAVMAQVPGAYLKSRAATFDHTTEIPVLITCEGADPAEVEARLARARALLAEACGVPDPGD